MKLNAEYVFIRHAEHPTKSNRSVEYVGGLTQLGIEEARHVGLNLNFISTDRARASIPANKRSATTATLALAPGLDCAEVKSIAEKYIESGRIVVDGRLDYRKAPHEFLEELKDAFLASRGLEFLVFSSRESKWRNNPTVSTYDNMAHTMARKLSKIHETYTPQIVCAREFFYPSLRARLIEQQLGSVARDNYVEWYGEKIEWSNDARTQIQTAQVAEVSGKNKLLIEDGYGTSEYPVSILNEI